MKLEQPAAVAIGKGFGSTTIYLVARGEDNALYFTKRLVPSTDASSWPEAWSPLGISSSVRPALAEAFDGKLALAVWSFLVTSRIDVRLYDPNLNTWSAAISAGLATPQRPQLVWDGTALNVFFIANDRLQHVFAASDSPLTFQEPVEVSGSLLVLDDDYHVIPFNNRLHIVFRRKTGSPPPQEIWYTTSLTPYGERSQWAPPSYVGFNTRRAPKIAWLYENLFVIGIGGDSRVVYSRKDPNRPGSEWLEKGKAIDPKTPGAFFDLDVLSFNSDLYLSANKASSGNSAGGTYLINFSRAAMKQLLTEKWGMKLLWGEPGGGAVKNADDFAVGEEIPGIGGFNGDGKDDLIKFTQKAESGVGPAPVYVALNDGGKFGDNEVWHTFFLLKGEIPLVGDFNGDGKDDIITFTQQQQKDAAGNVIGPAVVWVSLSDGTKFGQSRVWHKFFSLKGEIPLVGDFNGDGKDDIITFVQKAQHASDGSLLGHAPVWVALSDGTKFGQSRIWHTFFSLKGEIPQVGDLNLDGRADIVTFLVGKGAPGRERNVYVAFSQGNRFARSNTWHSDFTGPNQARLGQGLIVRSPVIGSFNGTTLDDITDTPADRDRYFPDIFAFRNDGAVHVATVMGHVPYLSGAPWEHYKWFTEKAVGVAQFPEWIWEKGPNHCIGTNHRFALLGVAGVGGATLTTSSVRAGGRAGHVLQEFGHSLFANCFRKEKDPFNLYKSIFETSVQNGGIEANDMPGCPDSFLGDGPCRDPEHYFLGLMEKYRLNGDEFRAEINNESNLGRKERLTAQYDWFKQKWFNGLEFKRGPSVNASLTQDGVPCLAGECQ